MFSYQRVDDTKSTISDLGFEHPSEGIFHLLDNTAVSARTLIFVSKFIAALGCLNHHAEQSVYKDTTNILVHHSEKGKRSSRHQRYIRGGGAEDPKIKIETPLKSIISHQA